jgi:hypothetical protein
MHQHLSHEDSAVITAQYGSPEQQQQHSCSSSKPQQPLHYVSASGVSSSLSQQLSSVSNPALTQQGKSSIHNANPTTRSTLLHHQNETDLLVKEIAMLDLNKMWNETASKVKPGETLSCHLSRSLSPSLVPHSSNFSGSVTSLSHQKLHPSGESTLTSVSAGLSSLNSVYSSSTSSDGVTSTVMQGTRTAGVSAEKNLPASSSFLGSSEFHKHGINPGKQVYSRPIQLTFTMYLNIIH